MRQSLVYVSVMLVAITGCASRPVQITEQTQREASVDQRMLAAQPPAEGAAAIAAYVLAPTQRFRMPRALRSDAPQLAHDTARTSLPPTTVCAHVILDASGTVQRVDPMSDRDACAAGLLPANADLLQAVRATVQQWQFVPAALCAFAPGVAQPADMDDCTGAERQEPVPVTLSFAFTFEIRQGKVSVQTGKVGR
ncbi:hypothetical protein [Xanthomonas sp. fls2-241-TYG-148]|uniref:hypothetical protein n=1 Tax=Xanthomonas sp. fls2-241-TYG-148 TaxID=3040328 RepID=UPI002554A5F2|nr:hypothetical protein [Xanthomonas sp. fls2-241-TYG-148]